MRKGQISLCSGESRFVSQLSELLQLVNVSAKDVWDHWEHNYLKKRNEKLLWAQNL
jgi:hypothetical protein